MRFALLKARISCLTHQEIDYIGRNGKRSFSDVEVWKTNVDPVSGIALEGNIYGCGTWGPEVCPAAFKPTYLVSGVHRVASVKRGEYCRKKWITTLFS